MALKIFYRYWNGIGFDCHSYSGSGTVLGIFYRYWNGIGKNF